MMRSVDLFRALAILAAVVLVPACKDDDEVAPAAPAAGNPQTPTPPAQPPPGGGDGAGSIQFSASSYTVDESGGTVTLTVQRGGSAGAASAWYQTDSHTATSDDYEPVPSRQLVWADGDGAPKTVQIGIKQDGAVEGQESFYVHLGSNSGAALGSTIVARVDINDDESAPAGVFQFGSPTYLATEKTHVTISVIRYGGTAGTATVQVSATPGTATSADFAPVSGAFPMTLSWANGDGAPKSFNIALTEDGTTEGDETFRLSLGAPSPGSFVGSPAEAEVRVADADSAGQIGFDASGYGASEFGGARTITVRRSGGVQGAVSATVSAAGGTATSGVDYTFSPSTLSWADGEGGDKTFTVTLVSDGAAEGSETAVFQLGGFTGGATAGSPSSATLTISE
jgi:hypothetical protein